MPTINNTDKTITWVCQADDESIVRAGLTEALEAHPGFTPVLIIESGSGDPQTITDLAQTTSTRRSRATTTTVLEPETITPDEVEVEDEVVEGEEADDDGGDDEEDDGE